MVVLGSTRKPAGQGHTVLHSRTLGEQRSERSAYQPRTCRSPQTSLAIIRPGENQREPPDLYPPSERRKNYGLSLAARADPRIEEQVTVWQILLLEFLLTLVLLPVDPPK